MVRADSRTSVGERRGARAGFTLVELLVVVAVIAALIGILLPALGQALGASKDAVCLSNLKQHATAWNAYLDDHERFPERGAFDWGGVDWYAATVWENGLNPNRPINPYLASAMQEKGRAAVFLCPKDRGARYFGDATEMEYWFAGASESEEIIDKSMYAQLGTSYRANEWIWVIAGSKGMIGAPTYNRTKYNSRNQVTDPGRFILVGDMGPFVLGRCARDRRAGCFGAWWHGEEVSNFAFIDGHAATHTMKPGTARTPEYSFYLAPEKHPRDSWVYASSSLGSPPVPAN